MRKKAGLKPEDKILIQAYGSDNMNKILGKKKDFILKETMAKDFKIGKETGFGLEKETKLDKEALWLGIKKIR